MKSRQIRLATFLTPGDVHVAAWRHPTFRYNDGADFAMYLAAAQAAERAKFDLALLGDVPARATEPDRVLATLSKYDILDPQAIIAALAVTTSHIGLAATASTTYNYPYHIARRFASVDHLSKGRAAWNVVTTANPTEAFNFGFAEHPDPAARYARAEEFVDVVFGLWNSWQANDFVRDKAAAEYFRPDCLKPLDHRGEHFTVRGPLDVARSPQERPIVVQAGSSEPGRQLAARVADIVFTSQQSLNGAKSFYADLKGRTGAFGRRPEDLLIVTGVMPYVAETEAAAREKFQELQNLIDPGLAIAKLSEMLGEIDLSIYDASKPLPDDLPPPSTIGITSRRKGIIDYGARSGLSLGELARWLAGTRGHVPIIGTASTIADWMQNWFEEGAADGFLVFPYAIPEALNEFGSLVVPELQRRGLFKTEYEGSTLRERLGLCTPNARKRDVASNSIHETT